MDGPRPDLKTGCRQEGGAPPSQQPAPSRDPSEAPYPDRFRNSPTDTPIMISVGNR